MGRKKIEKIVLYAHQSEKDSRFNLYKLIEENPELYKMEFLGVFPYKVWEIQQIYEKITNDILTPSANEKLQLILQVDENTYLYRSCNTNGQVYQVDVNPNEIECDCTWSNMYIKTGLSNKMCHHVREVKFFAE